MYCTQNLKQRICRNSKTVQYQMTDIFFYVFLSTMRAFHIVCISKHSVGKVCLHFHAQILKTKLSFMMRSPKVSGLHRQLTLHHKIKAV